MIIYSTIATYIAYALFSSLLQYARQISESRLLLGVMLTNLALYHADPVKGSSKSSKNMMDSMLKILKVKFIKLKL